MNREIKFRAWDDNGKDSRMYYPGDRTADDTRLMLNMHGDLLEARKLHKGEVNHTPDEAYNHAVYPARIGHSLTLMQYTGSEDKTGKEIYEGDILTSDHADYTPGYRWVVEWRDAGFYPFNDVDEQSHGDFDTMEIIGNIYQNPELLKQA